MLNPLLLLCTASVAWWSNEYRVYEHNGQQRSRNWNCRQYRLESVQESSDWLHFSCFALLAFRFFSFLFFALLFLPFLVFDLRFLFLQAQQLKLAKSLLLWHPLIFLLHLCKFDWQGNRNRHFRIRSFICLWASDFHVLVCFSFLFFVVPLQTRQMASVHLNLGMRSCCSNWITARNGRRYYYYRSDKTEQLDSIQCSAFVVCNFA